MQPLVERALVNESSDVQALRDLAATVDVEELMDTPAGRDEVGTPDHLIEECGECGTLYRTGGWHRCGGGDRR